MYCFKRFSCSLLLILLCISCSDEPTTNTVDLNVTYAMFADQFGAKIDLNSLPQYANQAVPAYINKDNTADNPITNVGALLGRILFYDKKLSSDNTISCSSCHVQANAFSDVADVSTGVNGMTGRHSMRLVNSRFSTEAKFFWDERAATLEAQTTQPIQDHNEMGFSGADGDESISDLIVKLQAIGYYQDLFTLVYGDSGVTEARMQSAMAQFIRSIQSFDSKYDQGRATVNNDNQNFANFTADENAGKLLFLRPPPQGGAGCAGCHRPPEFDIDQNSGNNGVVGVFGSAETDLTVTRSPTLRDVIKVDGAVNGALMHDASMATLEDVVAHYNNGIVLNASLDNRLAPGGVAQDLGLSAPERTQIVDFLKTLSGTDVYTNDKWSDPF